jgi:hypothetical protein
MSIATVVTRGYGTFGAIPYLPQHGYGSVLIGPMHSCLAIDDGALTAVSAETGLATVVSAIDGALTVATAEHALGTRLSAADAPKP